MIAIEVWNYGPGGTDSGLLDGFDADGVDANDYNSRRGRRLLSKVGGPEDPESVLGTLPDGRWAATGLTLEGYPFALEFPPGSKRTKGRFTGEQWIGAEGRNWRDAHRCAYPHGGSDEDSAAHCPAWRSVAPSKAETDRALEKHWAKQGITWSGPFRRKSHGRSASRAERRRGLR